MGCEAFLRPRSEIFDNPSLQGQWEQGGRPPQTPFLPRLALFFGNLMQASSVLMHGSGQSK
jgi:hypothetical protein